MTTIDISDLCTDTLNLSYPKDFRMYRDAVHARLNKFLDGGSLYGDVEYEDLLLILEYTDDIDNFLVTIDQIDTYLTSKNIHFITCL